jgi:hypothetical protein
MKPINLLEYKVKKAKEKHGYVSTSMFTKKENADLRKALIKVMERNANE